MFLREQTGIESLEKSQRELDTLLTLKKHPHPNLLLLVNYSIDNNKINLLLPYMKNGDLLDFINNFHSVEGETNTTIISKSPKIQSIVKGIAEALIHLHDNLNIIHRDIKPENVLLNEKDEPIVSDFDLSVQLKDDNEKRMSRCGTLYYFAPEITRELPYGKEVDMWSFGILVYGLLTNKSFFYCNPNLSDSKAEEEFLNQIGKKGTDDNQVKDFVKNRLNTIEDKPAKDFLVKLLKTSSQVEERMTAAQALDHPYINNADLACSFCLNPCLKII